MRALTRPLALAVAAAATFLATPSDAAYCVGTTQIGTACATVWTPPVGVERVDDCVYVLVGDCVPVTYYRPTVSGQMPSEIVHLTCTGIFAISASCS